MSIFYSIGLISIAYLCCGNPLAFECPPNMSESVTKTAVFENDTCFFIVENATKNSMIETRQPNFFTFNIENARKICNDNGGTLPKIRTHKENRFILQKFASADFWPEAPVQKSCLALGMQVHPSKKWVWDDGSRVDYHPTNWSQKAASSMIKVTCTSSSNSEILWFPLTNLPSRAFIGVLCQARTPRLPGFLEEPQHHIATPKTAKVNGSTLPKFHTEFQHVTKTTKLKPRLSNCDTKSKHKFYLTAIYDLQWCHFYVPNSINQAVKEVNGRKVFDIQHARKICSDNGGQLLFSNDIYEYVFAWKMMQKLVSNITQIPLGVQKINDSHYLTEQGDIISELDDLMSWNPVSVKTYVFTSFQVLPKTSRVHFMDANANAVPQHFLCKEAVPFPRPKPKGKRLMNTKCDLVGRQYNSGFFDDRWCYFGSNEASKLNDTDKAREYCQSMNATLPIIRSRKENNFLVDTFLQSGEYSGIALGIQDPSQPIWRWDNGAQVQMDMFHIRKPFGDKNQSVVILTKYKWWITASSKTSFLVVCKQRLTYTNGASDPSETDDEETTTLEQHISNCDARKKSSFQLTTVYDLRWCYFVVKYSKEQVAKVQNDNLILDVQKAREICANHGGRLPFSKDSFEYAYLGKKLRNIDSKITAFPMGIERINDTDFMTDDGEVVQYETTLKRIGNWNLQDYGLAYWLIGNFSSVPSFNFSTTMPPMHFWCKESIPRPRRKPSGNRVTNTKCDTKEFAYESKIFEEEFCYFSSKLAEDSANYIDFVTSKVNMTAARGYCGSNGGTLPIIRSRTEMWFLIDTFLTSYVHAAGILLGIKDPMSDIWKWDNDEYVDMDMFQTDGSLFKWPPIQSKVVYLREDSLLSVLPTIYPKMVVCKQPLYREPVPTVPVKPTTVAIPQPDPIPTRRQPDPEPARTPAPKSPKPDKGPTKPPLTVPGKKTGLPVVPTDIIVTQSTAEKSVDINKSLMMCMILLIFSFILF